MIDYRAGVWGFTVAFGWNGSLAPRALTMAIPNALVTFIIATWFRQQSVNEFNNGDARHIDADSQAAYNVISETSQAAQLLIASFTSVMIFILYNRSNTAYDRWWEGGTLLQKTRGEWFNAYSSIMAFTSTKPELQAEVTAYTHLLARLMSLLMCCGLQQVSPNRDRPFEIIDLGGIEPASMEFLNQAPDKVEIILQWIQRSMVLHAQTGVLPVAPPILSRAFQEVSRGIVNLQNARKIADFPYPFPLAQVSMILQLLHYAVLPLCASLAMPRTWAVLVSFFSIFVLWCIHFNALDLEFPFGTRVNDLPMNELQQEWNKSIVTLLAERACHPPKFDYESQMHDALPLAMSDASALYVPTVPVVLKAVSVIKVGNNSTKKLKKSDSSIGKSYSIGSKTGDKQEPTQNGSQAPPHDAQVVAKHEANVIKLEPDRPADNTSASNIGPTPGQTSASQVLSEHISRKPSSPPKPAELLVLPTPSPSVPPRGENQHQEGASEDRQKHQKYQNGSSHTRAGNNAERGALRYEL